MAIRKVISRSISGPVITVGDLAALIDGDIDAETPVSITKIPKDRPFDSDSYSLTITTQEK